MWAATSVLSYPANTKYLRFMKHPASTIWMPFMPRTSLPASFRLQAGTTAPVGDFTKSWGR